MYDVIIIGGGPAGYPCAIRCAQQGLRVCLIEERELGGVCLNRGCIPTKSLFSVSCEAGKTGFKSLNKTVDFQWDKVLSEIKTDVVMRLRMGVSFLLKQNGVEVKQGTGAILDPSNVKVGGETLQGRNIVVASGGTPCTPEICRVGERTITSDDLWKLETLPKSMAIVGGGVIGCEFASIFNKFGVDVTIYEMMENLLPETDIEVAQCLKQSLSKRGINILTGKRIESIDEITQEKILVTVGREPRLPDFGSVNIETEKGAIKTDSMLRTSVPGIYAAGDINGKHQYAYIATREGEIAAGNIAGKEAEIIYENIPSTTFTDPEVSSCGITEKQAKEEGINISVGKFPYNALGKAHSDKHTEGFVKVLASKDTDEILGVHMIGKCATELISFATLAVNSRLKVGQLEKMLYCHPTYAEGIMEAVEDINSKSIHMPPKK